MTTDTRIRDAALGYARLGWRVVPLYGVTLAGPCDGAPACECRLSAACGSPGKHPRIREWQREASADPSTVARWWRRWPGSNVGLAMGGPSRLVALDVDGAAGLETLARLSAELGELPRTLSSRSGRADGGRHLFFALPLPHELDAVRNRAGGRLTGPGLDIRAEGGQVVAAPSLHASGGRYAWLDVRPPALLPANWADALTAEPPAAACPALPPNPNPTRAPRLTPAPRPVAYARAVLRRACLELVGAPCGTRNSTAARLAFSVGGYVWTGAYSVEDAVGAMLDATRAGDWHRNVEAVTAATLRRQVTAGGERPRALPPPVTPAVDRGDSRASVSDGR